MTLRALRVLPALLCVLTGCAGGGSTKARIASTQDLMLVQATYGPVKNGQSGAPVDALIVSGTISNKGAQPLECSVTSFLLSDAVGNAIVPAAVMCQVPQIGPGRAAAFTLTFKGASPGDVQLRFEHGDGSYEIRDLTKHAR